MPGFLLTKDATVQCVHGGQAQPTVFSARVKINEQPIVTMAAPYSITGCPFNVSGSPVPCVTAQWTTVAVRVKSDNLPVVLLDSQATCVPNGTPLLILSTQTKVTGT
ncbi:MAG: hypothetical protein EOP46_04365 [Sphingobacteriaceae bacterium]|nr:MAG: hypothetical protein EOP46_04365 [Sphingobacteriaceae bacterium]